MSTHHKPAKGTSKPAQAMARAKSLRIVRASAAPLKPWHKGYIETTFDDLYKGLSETSREAMAPLQEGWDAAEAAKRLHATIFLPHFSGISIVGRHLLRPAEVRHIAVRAGVAEITWNGGAMKHIPLHELLGEAPEAPAKAAAGLKFHRMTVVIDGKPMEADFLIRADGPREPGQSSAPPR